MKSNRIQLGFIVFLITFLITGMLNAQTANDYRRAAMEGNADAQFNLALCYYLGEGGVERDGNLALYWFEQAISNRDKVRATAEILIRNLKKEGYSSSSVKVNASKALSRKSGPGRAAMTLSKQKYINWMEPQIEHNVTVNGRKGINIHATFTVGNLSKRNMLYAVFFRLKNGPVLKTSNKAYRSGKGELSVCKRIVPDSDKVNYDNLVLFIPYDEFVFNSKEKTHDIVCSVVLLGQSENRREMECFVSSDLDFKIDDN
jgi:hypothetical protein